MSRTREQDMRNPAYNHFLKSSFMPNAVKAPVSGKRKNSKGSCAAKEASQQFNPLQFTAESREIRNSHEGFHPAMMNDPRNLALTMGYETLPIHAWTREQLEEQLMILKQREMGLITGSQMWLAGYMATRYPAAVAGAAGNNGSTMLATGETDIHSKDKDYHEAPNLQEQFKLFDAQQQMEYMILDELGRPVTPAANHVLNFADTGFNNKPCGKNNAELQEDEAMLDETHTELTLGRIETKLISDDGAHMTNSPSDADSEFDFSEHLHDTRKKRMVNRANSNFTHLASSFGVTTSGVERRTKNEEAKAAFAEKLSSHLRQDYVNFTRSGVLTNELRLEYIRLSKLYPKVRGVWFNSTVRRMGWVGQAYKKCKRIEKIFSISKHGFEGARELAIAFRNSQKPSSTNYVQGDAMVTLDTSYSVATNDDFFPAEPTEITKQETKDDVYNGQQQPVLTEQSTLLKCSVNSEDTIMQPELTVEYDESNVADENNDFARSDAEFDDMYGTWLKQYTSSLTDEQKSHRDFLCKGVLRFMLYELSVLMTLDVPVPLISKDAIKRGIQYHIEILEACESAEEMAPYMAIFGDYICKGITPVDMPFDEVATIVRAFSYCRPLTCDFANPGEIDLKDEVREESLIDLIKV